MNRWLTCCLILTATAFVSALALPTEIFRERIPTHWNLDMEPDAWTNAPNYPNFLLIMPGIMVLMTLLLWLLPRISPKSFETERFSDTFGYGMTIVVGYLAYFQGLLIWVGIEDHPLWGKCFLAGIFILFAFLGNIMGKVQRNFWMGVRTPWTLASETVWNQTHRQAAWLWFASGLLGCLLVLVGVAPWIPFVLLMLVVFWPILYSLLLYKSLERQGRL